MTKTNVFVSYLNIFNVGFLIHLSAGHDYEVDSHNADLALEVFG